LFASNPNENIFLSPEFAGKVKNQTRPLLFGDEKPIPPYF
jgi:hypothetical protein